MISSKSEIGIRVLNGSDKKDRCTCVFIGFMMYRLEVGLRVLTGRG